MDGVLEVIHFDAPQPYAAMLDRQRERRDAVARGDAPDTLFLLEHTPVITLGRDADTAHLLRSEDELRDEGIEVCPTDRGGDVTYHGPGQLVAYPILNLERRGRSVGRYLRTLEQAIIDTLAEHGIEGERVEGFTGVWVNGAKVAAIGVGIHRWVTFHGIALNVVPNMRHFERIVPCGIADKPVTALSILLPKAPRVDAVAKVFEAAFRNNFTNEKD